MVERRFLVRIVARTDGRNALGMREVLSEAVSIYFVDVTLASAFVARWCVGSKVETTGGKFQVREDEPAPRVGAAPHRIP